jgi:hypothetical protein
MKSAFSRGWRVKLNPILLRRVVLDEIDRDEGFIRTFFAMIQTDLACKEQIPVS